MCESVTAYFLVVQDLAVFLLLLTNELFQTNVLSRDNQQHKLSGPQDLQRQHIACISPFLLLSGC
jgi:hypothetical protein